MFGTFTRALALVVASQANAQVFEYFAPARHDWVFVTDGVMGGVSAGEAVVAEGAVRLTSDVSTQNNGGFIQVRTRFGGGWPAEAEGLTLRMRGNGEGYYVFLRTTELRRPWHSYRASFVAGEGWAEVSLAFASFTAARPEMPARFTPDQVVSLGLVAYGRDFSADLSVDRITVY
jgi:hypothetical protein